MGKVGLVFVVTVVHAIVVQVAAVSEKIEKTVVFIVVLIRANLMMMEGYFLCGFSINTHTYGQLESGPTPIL